MDGEVLDMPEVDDISVYLGRSGFILSPPFINEWCGILQWDTLKVLRDNIDKPLVLQTISEILVGRFAFYIHKTHSEVQDAIYRLRKMGFIISSITQKGERVAYCWAGSINRKKMDAWIKKHPYSSGDESEFDL